MGGVEVFLQQGPDAAAVFSEAGGFVCVAAHADIEEVETVIIFELTRVGEEIFVIGWDGEPELVAVGKAAVAARVEEDGAIIVDAVVARELFVEPDGDAAAGIEE